MKRGRAQYQQHSVDMSCPCEAILEASDACWALFMLVSGTYIPSSVRRAARGIGDARPVLDPEGEMDRRPAPGSKDMISLHPRSLELLSRHLVRGTLLDCHVKVNRASTLTVSQRYQWLISTSSRDLHTT